MGWGEGIFNILPKLLGKTIQENKERDENDLSGLSDTVENHNSGGLAKHETIYKSGP